MQIAMTKADLLKWVAWGPVTVQKIWGWNSQNVDLYIQLHQVPPLANGTLTAGTVPAVKSLLAQSAFAFSFGPKDFGEGLQLKELLLAISSTEVNYTAVGADGGLDLFIEVSGSFLCDGTEVVSGDLSTGRDTFDMSTVSWNDAVASVNFRLLRVDYTNKSGAAAWLMGFADAAGAVNDAKPDLVVTYRGTPAAGTVPAGVPNNTNVICTYGSEGTVIFGQTSAGVKHYGLVFWESSDGTKLAYTATNASYIRVIHRPSA